MLNESQVVTISNKELYESTSSRNAAAIKKLCDVIAFDAAIQQELAEINELAEADQQPASDARLADFSVQLTFKDRKLIVDLSCLDTYDAFISMLVCYEAEIDLYR